MNEFESIGELMPSARGPKSSVSPDDVALSEAEELVLDLTSHGIGLRKAQHLVATYPAGKIRQQLEWLPMRRARRRGSLLIVAIEQDYGPPVYAE